MDFAKAIGCTPHNLRRWLEMKTPPARMRRGFDASLSRALHLSQSILFRDWATQSPSDAPFVPIPQATRAISKAQAVTEEGVRGRIAEAVEGLREDDLYKVLRLANVLKQSQAERAMKAYEAYDDAIERGRFDEADRLRKDYEMIVRGGTSP